VRWLRPLITLLGLLLLWQLLVWLSGVAPYLLPPPSQVFSTWLAKAPLLLHHTLITVSEILLGLLLGALLGIASALTMLQFARARRWLLPLLVVSQALPVFALAPLLMLWLGYGIASKVTMAVLIIFFPVTAACYDGLRHTHAGWIDLARTMNATPAAILRHIRLPAALPALASGLRIAAAVAPIGAVVGEWVGSSGGLGYLMLHANARMQIDLMFAALFTLALFAVALYSCVDALMKRLLRWQPETVSLTDEE
jgi:putative hydroxymethylpyrimidine transport system permease protein